MWIFFAIVTVLVCLIVIKQQNNSKVIKQQIEYLFDIVGEQSYQKNLKMIAGPKEEQSKFHECFADISSEPNNPYDKNAVKVEINGLLVGYLNKHDAKKLAGETIKKRIRCVINGGWLDNGDEGSYGVKLAINNVYDLV